MGVFNFYTDEDNRLVQDTEGRCASCGEWAEERVEVYGQYVCISCSKSEIYDEEEE